MPADAGYERNIDSHIKSLRSKLLSVASPVAKTVQIHEMTMKDDVMLPGLSGIEVLRRIRARSQVPVVLLTARGDNIDRITGLELCR